MITWCLDFNNMRLFMFATIRSITEQVLRCWLAVCLFFSPIYAAAQAGAPFTCDVVFYQMRNNGTQSLLVKFASVSSTVTPTAATPAINPTIAINSIGYNPVDNYIYGIRAQTAV
jgi:hypothetical protein